MKVLLINHPYSYETPYLQVTEPLGILYLAAYLRKFSTHEVSILDCLANRLVTRIGHNKYWYGIKESEILAKVETFNPDIIGISCNFSRKKSEFLSCGNAIRKKFPGKILIGGGTYPSLFPEDTLNSGVFDYVIIGEGEQSFLDLVNSLSQNCIQLDKIEGLAFNKDGQIVINPKSNYIANLDQIPFPARDLINYELYLTRKSVMHGLGLGRIASILTSRSCPNRCNFCSMFRIHGPQWRRRSARNVVDEIVHLQKNYNVEELFIMDDNFTIQRERVLEICELIIRLGIRIRWNTPNGLSINTIDREMLISMKKAGCVSICVAIESGDDELRNIVIGKCLKTEKIEEVVRCAVNLGIMVTAFYIIGMPGETDEKFERTIEQVRTLPFNGVAAAFANPLPGTKLYQDCLDNRWILLDSDENRKNVFYKPYVLTPDFEERDLLFREKRFYQTFLRYHLGTILKDTLLFRNKLLYPPFLMRVVRDRLFRE